MIVRFEEVLGVSLGKTRVMSTAPPQSDRLVVGVIQLAPGALGMVSAIMFHVLASTSTRSMSERF